MEPLGGGQGLGWVEGDGIWLPEPVGQGKEDLGAGEG